MYYYCSNCKKCWNHPIDRCIFCGKTTTQIQEDHFKVIGYTEVFIPSTENEKVPYFVSLLEDQQGNKKFQKSFQKPEIGKTININENIFHPVQIGVVGSGLMGIQIATYMIQFGFPTILKTRNEESKGLAIFKIEKNLSKRMCEEDVKKILHLLIVTINSNDLEECDIIIEAITEDIDLKKEVFKDLTNVIKKSAILATNSSSLSIDDLAKVTDRPDRCIGMHFFNPIHRMNLVEVVIGTDTSDETRNIIVNFVLNVNKTPIIVKNSPGYVINRLLLPQINEAIYVLEDGIASKEDIDKAVRLGLNHPMGPFELADFIGLDICLSILNVLYYKFNNPKYKPSPLLETMVNEGKLGYKTREGFYKY